MISASYQFNIKQKIVILSIGLILFALILIVFLLVPNIRDIKVLYADLYKRRQETADLIQLNSTPVILEQQLNILKTKMADLESSLLIPGQEINFVQSLEDFSRQYDIKQTINLNPTVSQDEEFLFPSADLSLTLQTSFNNFLKYLIALDSCPYYINIASISVSSGEVRPSVGYVPQVLPPIQSSLELAAEHLVTAQINAKVFWKNE